MTQGEGSSESWNEISGWTQHEGRLRQKKTLDTGGRNRAFSPTTPKKKESEVPTGAACPNGKGGAGEEEGGWPRTEKMSKHEKISTKIGRLHSLKEGFGKKSHFKRRSQPRYEQKN